MTTNVRTAHGIYFTDLPALVVGGMTQAPAIGAGWISFRHSIDDTDCVGLATGAGSGAGELVLDLGLTGWHTLHLCALPSVLVRLDGDPFPRELHGYSDGSQLRDFPLPPADLTDKKLHIAPRNGADPAEAIVFYLRAEPCDGPRTSHRNLIATNDGHGVICGLEGIDDLYTRYFEPMRDSDFFRVLYGVYGSALGTLNPETRAGELIEDRSLHATSQWERRWFATLEKFKQQGIDVTAEAVKAAHATGLEIHLYIRPEAFYHPFPHEGMTANFYHEHPEWRCRDEFDREVRRMSYAYPEVREAMLDFYRELLDDCRPDGLCLAFNRSIPMMICEEPVLQAFRRKYGREARLPEEVDTEEMLAVRHEILDDYLAQVHELVAARGMALSCIIPRNLPDVRLRGLDIERAVRQGYFESVVVGAGHGDPQDEIIADLQRLQSLGTRVFSGGSSGGANGGFWPPSDPRLIAERMAHLLDAGIGGHFWDVDAWFARSWDIVAHAGDRDFLATVLDGRYAPPHHQTTSICGMVPDRYNPWWSY